MGSGGVHKSLGRFKLMNLTGRKSGKVRGKRVAGSRAFALTLPALLGWMRPLALPGAFLASE